MKFVRDGLIIITPCRRNDNLSRCTTVVVLVKLMFLHIIQRPHPTPILQGESCANLIIQKPIGKTKKTKQPKRSMPKPSKTIGKTKKNFWAYGPLRRHRLKSFDLLLVFPMVFDCFGIDLFGCFGFLGFPTGFWYSQPGSRANPLGDGSVSTYSPCSIHFF